MMVEKKQINHWRTLLITAGVFIVLVFMVDSWLSSQATKQEQEIIQPKPQQLLPAEVKPTQTALGKAGRHMPLIDPSNDPLAPAVAKAPPPKKASNQKNDDTHPVYEPSQQNPILLQ